MLGSLWILYLVACSLKLTSANVRRHRWVYRVGPQSDPLEGKEPPVILQLSPGFLDQPGLKDIYAALSQPGGSEDGLYLQLSPSKREAGHNPEGDTSAFALRVNPVLPRNPLSVKKFNNSLCEGNVKSWCVEIPPSTPKICPPLDTPPPTTTTCGPTKPRDPERMYPFCDPEKSIASQKPKDLCDESRLEPTASTAYVPCRSYPPPTASEKLIYCNPTTMTCNARPQTYKVGPHGPTTTCTPTPPPCDAGQCKNVDPHVNLISELRNPARYYILVKRSPDGWAARKKRSSKLRRRFRLVPELYR